MRLSLEELTAGIDDDFKEVIASLSQIFSYGAQMKKGRATHTFGVAARGTARCIISPNFPENDFFKFGQEHKMVLRHSSPGGELDDRTRDGCAASVKIFDVDSADTSSDGSLDVLMNAGRQLFVRSIRDFLTMVQAPLEKRTELCQQGLIMDKELTEAYRIRGSFADFRYHSWTCFEFFDANGKMNYIRFRLVPGDRGPERGLPPKDFDCEGQLTKPPVEGDPRAEDFLRQDFVYRVNHSDISYILQAQLHEPENPTVENSEVLNPALAWDETFYPWLDLYEINVEEIIVNNDEVSSLTMDPNRSPECIKIPLATSPDHFASLCQARAIVYPAARSKRKEAEHPQNN
jgi:catalase